MVGVVVQSGRCGFFGVVGMVFRMVGVVFNLVGVFLQSGQCGFQVVGVVFSNCCLFFKCASFLVCVFS